MSPDPNTLKYVAGRLASIRQELEQLGVVIRTWHPDLESNQETLDKCLRDQECMVDAFQAATLKPGDEHNPMDPEYDDPAERIETGNPRSWGWTENNH